MCAINGTTKENKDLVERMNAATLHRGPDGSRIWVGDGITLGHNRLAIIDLAERASQPMRDTSGRYRIVFNGEIYNYRELREELKSAHAFNTESDTEVLLTAYRAWGEEMFPRLRGIFAFGIWDSEKKELVLARDHMGVKPLYYTIENNILSFSSEIPALLKGKKQAILDETSIAFYLSMEYVPGPRTLVEGISKLRPGQLLRFKDGRLTAKSFLDKIPHKAKVPHEEVYRTIDSAVHRQLVSDRPVGAYLSGGFDSSIVVHHMAQHAQRTRTYSVDFEPVPGQEDDSFKFNADAKLAAKTAAFYGAEHTNFRVTLGNVRETIEAASEKANEPIANSTAITQFLLSDFVRKDGVVVVLGGDAGDELFGGYTRHRMAMGAYLYQWLPTFVQKLGGKLNPRIGKLGTPFGTPLHRAFLVKDEKKIQPFLKKDLNIDHLVTNYFDECYESVADPNRHPMDLFMQADRQTWLPDECFIRSDYASMAHGVELRVPFADTDVVNLSDRISIWKKTLPHEGKRIIRKTYRQFLPQHLYGQPKRGWISPAAKWFRDPVIGELAKNVYSLAYYSGLDGLFDWHSVQKLLDAHIEKRGYYLYPLWNILVLQIWARANGVTIRR
jgi:asparagine synthase (glutamine-hydrolysing)